MKRKTFKKREKYMIPVDGRLYETTREIYETYYRMERRERYLIERDQKNGLTNFSDLNNDKYLVVDKIEDMSIDIEEEVMRKIIINEVLEAIKTLDEKEFWLIQELFFYGKSEVLLAKESGVARTTIRSRKVNVLKKIKKIIKM